VWIAALQKDLVTRAKAGESDETFEGPSLTQSLSWRDCGLGRERCAPVLVPWPCGRGGRHLKDLPPRAMWGPVRSYEAA
jgi:hypothetical protein